MTNKKPKVTKSQTRGIGKGHAAGLGMTDAYTREKILKMGWDAVKCCGCTISELVHVPTIEECSCYCHETPRIFARFS